MARDFSRAFYSSALWLRCRSGYIALRRSIDGGMCETCHERPGYIVHHKTELTPENINDPDIALNFDNLKYDCLTCHNKENGRGAKEAEGLVRYVFDEEGNMIPVGADSPLKTNARSKFS